MYAAVLTDPLSLLGQQPCIPDANAIPSFKYSSRLRTTFTVGTSSVGGVAVWPHMLGVNGPIIGPIGAFNYEFPKVRCTTAEYAATNALFGRVYAMIEGTTVPGTVNNNAFSSLFTKTDFVNRSRSLRLVGSGIRITYTGSLTDQRGTVYFVRNPTASPVLPDTFDNVDELLASQAVVRTNVRNLSPNGTNGTTYLPLSERDSNMIAEPYSDANLAQVDGVPTRLGYMIMVTGATPGTGYDIDVISYFEAYGTSLPLTQSESDPGGTGAVRAAVAANSTSSDVQTSHASTIAGAMLQLAYASGKAAVRTAMPYIGDVAIRGLESMAEARMRPSRIPIYRPAAARQALMG